jgi:hypothetical protein
VKLRSSCLRIRRSQVRILPGAPDKSRGWPTSATPFLVSNQRLCPKFSYIVFLEHRDVGNAVHLGRCLFGAQVEDSPQSGQLAVDCSIRSSLVTTVAAARGAVQFASDVELLVACSAALSVSPFVKVRGEKWKQAIFCSRSVWGLTIGKSVGGDPQKGQMSRVLLDENFVFKLCFLIKIGLCFWMSLFRDLPDRS